MAGCGTVNIFEIKLIIIHDIFIVNKNIYNPRCVNFYRRFTDFGSSSSCINYSIGIDRPVDSEKIN